MKYKGLTLGGAALVGLLAAPANAGEPGWTVRGHGVLLSPSTSQTIVNDDGVDIFTEASSGFGGGGAVEYQFHPIVGVEGGILVASPEISLSADLPGFGALSVADSMTTGVFTLDAVFHLTPGSSMVDLYAGGGLARVNTGGLSFNVLDIERLNIEGKNYFTWSARAGIDLALGRDSGWAVSLGVRYVPGDLELRQLGESPDETEVVGYDILTFTAGVAYRF